MSDKMSELLSQYDMKTINTYRGRGALMCMTPEGLRILKPLETSTRRVEVENEIKVQLFNQGFCNTDIYLRNKQDSLFSLDKYQVPYGVRQYFDGRECNINNEEDIKLAINNLGKLHKALRKVKLEHEIKGYATKSEVFFKRNRELKRVRNFIKGVSKKSQFELIYMECFDRFYEQGLNAYKLLEGNNVNKMSSSQGICHGTYNHHSVLICEKNVATINFSNYQWDNQLVDLYYFIRKTLEKNNYAFKYISIILEEYNNEISLNNEDYILIYLLLAYPEKFWKISNQYINGKKTWIPPKTIEKIKSVIELEEIKNKMLEEYKEYYRLNF